MNTKVAISSQNKKTITGHAGKCLHFYIYTIKEDGNFDKELIHLEKNETLSYTFHEDKTPSPFNYLFDMDILLTLQIGQGGVLRLAKQNVTAYMVQEKNPDTAIKKLIEGTLEAIAPVNNPIGNHHC